MDLRGPFPAELLYVDPEKDLAFLTVATSISPLNGSKSHTFRRGQEVIAIGSPGAGDLTLQNAVCRGVVSTEAVYKGQSYYQLSIPINPGHSGGPVLDMAGEVVGVITLGNPTKEGLGFCITLPDLNSTLQQVDALTEQEIEGHRSQHRLGVLVQTISILTKEYSAVMGIYLGSMENAMSDGKSAMAGLEMVQEKIQDQVKGLSRLNEWMVDSELTNEATSVATDEHLPVRIREQFADLWINYKEIKSNVENPRGNVDTFREKRLQLADTHERLMHSLKLHLGVKE